MTVTAIKDPRRYFEAVDTRKRQATAPPVCLYLEVTNRCNLLCETCPRTFETLEPPADMTWELFTSIVDQVPDVARVVLHGVGEPMLVKTLPRMIRHLKDRGVYVLFNTNGTLLSAKKHQAMIDTGLDELRVSLDAADAKTFLAVRGKNFFDRIVRNVRSFTELQRATGATSPRVSLWLTGLKETIDQLPAFVRLAASMGVREVYLQRLTYDEAGHGLARFESSLFDRLHAERISRNRGCGRAGARPRHCARCIRRDRARSQPEAAGGGAALVGMPPPVVTDVFHRARAGAAVLHRAVLRARLRQLHAGRCDSADAARDLEQRDIPGLPRRAVERNSTAALRQLRLTLEPLTKRPALPHGVAAVIPTLNEAATIAGTIASIPRDVVDEIIVADSSSHDGTPAIAQAAGARVITLAEKGYGRACAAGAAASGAECG